MITPITTIDCPTRRRSIIYPCGDTSSINNTSVIPNVTKSDYAANGGDVWTEINILGHVPSDPGWPATAQGQADIAAMHKATTGVMYAFSRIRVADVTDGTSNTYLLGEKYVNHDNYEDGQDVGDNEAALIGDDRDITRWGGPAYVPWPDTPGNSGNLIFGTPTPMVSTWLSATPPCRRWTSPSTPRFTATSATATTTSRSIRRICDSHGYSFSGLGNR